MFPSGEIFLLSPCAGENTSPNHNRTPPRPSPPGTVTPRRDHGSSPSIVIDELPTIAMDEGNHCLCKIHFLPFPGHPVEFTRGAPPWPCFNSPFWSLSTQSPPVYRHSTTVYFEPLHAPTRQSSFLLSFAFVRCNVVRNYRPSWAIFYFFSS